MASKLFNLKADALKQLKQHLQKSPQESESPIETFTLYTDDIDLINMYGHIDLYPKTYFKTKSDMGQGRQYLGLGKTISLSNRMDTYRIAKIRDKNPELIFLGGEQFYEQSNTATEWHNFHPCHYILPRILFIKHPETLGTEMRIYFDKEIRFNQVTRMQLFLEIENSLNFLFFDAGTPALHQIDLIPKKDDWINSVKDITNTIKKGVCDKAVLARKILLKFDKNYSASQMLMQLKESSEQSYLYCFSPQKDLAFISITPERLFLKKGSELNVDCLAGTIARGDTLLEDRKLEDKLQNDPKEKEEHNIVKLEIQSALTPLCLFLEIPDQCQTLKLNYIQHLYTKVRGVLSPKTTFFDILSSLHPTPAVGGRPWIKAKKLIRQNESFERGLYAAPFGVIGPFEEEMAVGIRSALINKNEVHVYAGCGLVKNSDPNSEWLETTYKMNNFIKKLIPEVPQEKELEL